MKILLSLILFLPQICLAQNREFIPINKTALSLITEFEGFRSKPYYCAAGVKTIGYGFTSEEIVSRGEIDRQTAELILVRDKIPTISSYIESKVEKPLSESQKAALISFAFNLGEGNLDKILDKINKHGYLAASQSMLRYTKARVNGKLTELEGLKKRRAKENIYFQN